jgi:serine/threonine-protein kinase
VADETNDAGLIANLSALRAEQDDLEGQRIRALVLRQLVMSDDPAPRLGRFTITGVLGRGGAATVYAARDDKLERDIALKVLPARAADDPRLLDEARALARLNHPNVVALYDADRIGDQLVIAMELVRGKNLRRWWLSAAPTWRAAVAALVAAGRGIAAAHAAGLLHRDIKPENILIGEDGRVRVGDFGLATLDAKLDDPTAGTPRYMSPEQRAGHTLDARSDQYSFCVTLQELVEACATPAPRAVRRVVARALEIEPARRYPSMTALIDALERALTPRSRGWWLAGGAAACAALLAVVLVGHRETSPCDELDRRWSASWTPARRDQLSQAFAVTKVPYASDAARRVTAIADDTSHALKARCPADDAAWRACARRRLDQLDQLLRVLTEADAGVVERAAEATQRISSLSDCDDAGIRQLRQPPPGQPSRYVLVAAIHAVLDRVEVLEATGRYAAGLRLARETSTRAEALDDWPLRARSAYRTAVLERELADPKTAEASLLRAVEAAEAGRDDEIAAQAWIRLVSVARAAGNYDEAERRAALAAAKLVRLGNPAEHLAFYLVNIAMVRVARGDFGAARSSFERALALYEPLGPDRPRVVATLTSLSEVYGDLGERDLQMTTVKRAVAIAEASLGAQHPRTAEAIVALAYAERLQGRHREAAADLERVSAIRTAVFGPDSLQVAASANDLAGEEIVLGDRDAALAHLHHALAVRERLQGAMHPDVAKLLVNLAELVPPTEGIAYAERARAIYTNANQPLGIAATSHRVGAIRQALGDADAALRAEREALDIYRRLLPANHPKIGAVVHAIGKLELDRGQLTDAVRDLEAAVTIAEHGAIPLDLASTRLDLADALWKTRGDRARARALVAAARDGFAAAPGDVAAQLRAEADAWIAAHP